MARPVKMAEAAARREDKRATIACYQDDVNLVATPRAESLARSTFIEEMEKIGLVVHKVSVFTPLGGQPHPDRQLRQESRALILRYGAPCPVPALQDDSSEGDTMTRRDSQEVQQLLDKRSGMAHRLLQLRDAGLPTQFALAMFRHSLHEHAAFHHEHRERPGSYHHSNHMCTSARRRHFGGNSLTHFQPSTTWRVGYVECHHHSTANSSQGWAQCWRVFEITPILPTRTTSTLKHCTPWHSKSIKAHYPRRAWRVLTNRNFNLWQATAGPQPTRTPRAEMDDETFIVAARLRIGIPMGDHVTHCHKIYDDTICGAELDETRIHALISQLQGSTVHRHNRIRDTTAHILRESGQYNDVQIEQLVPEASDPSVAPRMGHHCSRTTGPTRPHCCDGRLCPHSDRASLRQRHETGRMLDTIEYRRYPGVQVTPAALETVGRPGDGVVNLIRKLGRNVNKTERAKFIDEAWQQISAALQTGNARAVIASRSATP